MGNNDLLEIQIPEANIILKTVTHQHRQFINDMFKDPGISEHFILPIDLANDHGLLVDLWLNNIDINAGYAWIICKKGVLLTGGDLLCGFFAFEYKKDSLIDVRISFALIPWVRRHGIMSDVTKEIFSKLKKMDVISVEAIIELDNVNAKLFFENRGFTIQNRKYFIDNDVLNALRVLYKKDIVDFSEIGYLLDEKKTQRLLDSNLQCNAYAETEPIPNTVGLRPTGRYKFIFKTEITEYLVGISSDDTRKYAVTWELTKELKVGPLSVMSFIGWENFLEDDQNQFEGYEICILTDIILHIIQDLMLSNPQKFSQDIMAQVVGLEGVSL